MKTVTIRITDKSKNSVLQDTTDGKTYTAYLLATGERYPYEPFLDASQPAVNFIDDTGDSVGAWVSSGGFEIVE